MDLHGRTWVLGAGLVATDEDQVTGLLMLLVERGHGLADVIWDSEGERVRVSWLQPDADGDSIPLAATARPLV